VVRLGRGDSLYFDSRLGHAYVSVSRQLARIIGMTIGESEHMTSAREAPVFAPAAVPAPAPAAARKARAAAPAPVQAPAKKSTARSKR
jgi:hypothetical protein